MADRVFWALTCSLLSLSGCVFLVLVGVLVHLQPQYMKLSKSVEGPAPIFESACLYATLFLVSSAVYYKETRKGDQERSDLGASTSDERQSLLDKPMVSYS
ncbi:hypothetical protein PHYSODRAFT_286547 [Phytophthora sojae]|uniref:Uncharacterized protein n=1 Tax=Phytophthora sojae (strain P6497) TaxID=1094619 RepID=G4ZT85_PHYSP|nr:hypothetical protein PHYSODRAFT_286547 [Phytophthora sojae]EGZ13117.1 hypothetical protein PHYSODRAFT_286547 [Phytophthora sojae]|eukprot:XP_009530546.1 hypothetical protein PHYSODRAFT_286547 [Phytophthora sojae]